MEERRAAGVCGAAAGLRPLWGVFMTAAEELVSILLRLFSYSSRSLIFSAILLSFWLNIFLCSCNDVISYHPQSPPMWEGLDHATSIKSRKPIAATQSA